ncbi:hypothetical protein MAUB_29160 [Mycolicibacterium aubagnense]|uniref:Uncharacterized protein n=1 Tax=Mycolicibacterium aubagnense TaxID=319707 RepID=A0ABN5YTU4_9MYCO|nr:hypothetical protein MAUB_29160 [Mycolicibacterium aubagnense]
MADSVGTRNVRTPKPPGVVSVPDTFTCAAAEPAGANIAAATATAAATLR